MPQNDLEYDPVLYRCNRGDLDWDQRSISSMNMLDNSKPAFYANDNNSSGQLPGYNHYIAEGPAQPDIELSQIPNCHGHQALVSQQLLLPMQSYDNSGRSPTPEYQEYQQYQQYPSHSPAPSQHLYQDQQSPQRPHTPAGCFSPILAYASSLLHGTGGIAGWPWIFVSIAHCPC